MKKIILPFLLISAAFAAKDTLSFVAVGDIMMGVNYPDKAPVLPPQDGALTFESVQDILKNADITVGNLEGVLLDSGGTAKQCSNPSVCYTFRMPERYVNLLVKAGFDLLSVANNHSGDFGAAGRKSSQKTLKEAGLGFAGFEETAETYILEKEGVRYGFAAFAPNNGTVRISDAAKAKRLISELKEKSDIVIVAMHIGAEGPGNAHITRKTEMFVGENRGNPYEFARLAIDSGADMVFGHGPHVPRAIDLYKGKFIAYSLGNFATSTNVNISGISGYAPIIKIKTDKEGNFIEGEIFSAIQAGESGSRRPILDSTGACIKKIKELTEADIPETKLFINENGKISVK
ncbi:MAG: CapA family protein [Candidatus Fibromonas sp.]|jgi:poly-gamma-glutamate capsule biosynthesis protein CapA/YwtB (metallophosphatase superfamily)|nr:CapA family protein [Candidatus Fibromonas sp.]